MFCGKYLCLAIRCVSLPPISSTSSYGLFLAFGPQGLLEKQAKESAARIDKLEQALSEVRKEYNQVWPWQFSIERHRMGGREILCWMPVSFVRPEQLSKAPGTNKAPGTSKAALLGIE